MVTGVGTGLLADPADARLGLGEVDGVPVPLPFGLTVPALLSGADAGRAARGVGERPAVKAGAHQSPIRPSSIIRPIRTGSTSDDTPGPFVPVWPDPPPSEYEWYEWDEWDEWGSGWSSFVPFVPFVPFVLAAVKPALKWHDCLKLGQLGLTLRGAQRG